MLHSLSVDAKTVLSADPASTPVSFAEIDALKESFEMPTEDLVNNLKAQGEGIGQAMQGDIRGFLGEGLLRRVRVMTKARRFKRLQASVGQNMDDALDDEA